MRRCWVKEMREPAGRGRWQFYEANDYEAPGWLVWMKKSSSPVECQRVHLQDWIANEHAYWETQKVKREYRLVEYRPKARNAREGQKKRGLNGKRKVSSSY
jgi:hypothetical protein